MRGAIAPAAGERVVAVAVAVPAIAVAWLGRGDGGAALATASFGACVVGAACAVRDARRGTWTLLAAAAVSALTGLLAGGAPGAGAMIAAAAALAAALAGTLRRTGASAPSASFAAAGLVLAPAALIFLADPWIEWRGSGADSPRRAASVLAASPVAALCSPQGGADVDWQRRPLLYDGIEERQLAGLSVIGQYYPSAPPSSWTWAAGLAVAALAAAWAAGPGRRDGTPSGARPSAAATPPAA